MVSVNFDVFRSKRLIFKTFIIERYKRRETSVEEVLIEMYFAGIIEGLEYCSGRYMDMDDLVFNCSGAWIGYFVYTRICLWWKARDFGSTQ